MRWLTLYFQCACFILLLDIAQPISSFSISNSVTGDRKGRKRNENMQCCEFKTLSQIDEHVSNNHFNEDKLFRKGGMPITPCANVGRIWENNESFYLIFVSPASTNCAACSTDILYIANIPGDNLCFKHLERYIYPTKKVGKQWTETSISKSQKSNFFYHAKAACIYSRFRQEYFISMPIHLGSGIPGILRQYPLDILHPSLEIYRTH